MDLYMAMEQNIDAFDKTLSAQWDGKRHPVLFSAELSTANGNRGKALLNPRTFEGCRLELTRRAEMAEISVADTGNGIAPENRQKIFQLFFTTRPGGSGIGLASAFRIVQLLNGSIDFKSEVGRGTTFRIELPLAA